MRGRVDANGREPKILCDQVHDHLTVNRPAKDAPPSRRQHLYITFRRTDQQEQDKRRLREIYALLQSYQGQDKFSFVVTGPGGKVQLDFPNASTRYCPGLVQDLDQLIGNHTIHITPLS